MMKLKLVLFATAVVLVAGLLMWKAEATPLTGAADPFAIGKAYSPLQEVGCKFGTSRCPAGTKWKCRHTHGAQGERKFCYCRPC
jgi:hypothetical protein